MTRMIMDPVALDALEADLRSSGKAFRENTVYGQDGDPLRLTVQADEAERAAMVGALRSRFPKPRWRSRIRPIASSCSATSSSMAVNGTGSGKSAAGGATVKAEVRARLRGEATGVIACRADEGALIDCPLLDVGAKNRSMLDLMKVLIPPASMS